MQIFFEDSISIEYYPDGDTEDDSRRILVHECAPNGQGIVALIALNILREFYKIFPPKPKETTVICKLDSAEDADRLHVMIEASTLGYSTLITC